MRLLVVHAHPCGESFSAALCRAVTDAAAQGAHECRLIDLYTEGFDPVMSMAEWQAYASTDASLTQHAAHLLWAEGVILVYPTWWQGPPAMMKGWMDRVWRPGVAFEVEGQHLRPLLKLKVLGVVTTLGAPNWLAAQAMGFTGRRMVLGGLAACAPRGLRKIWLALHAIESTTPEQRAQFLARVRRSIATLGD